MPARLHLRVFISSPGDVADERNLARRLLKEELPYDPFLRGKVAFDVISWDDPAAPTPMVATLTPQEAVNSFGYRPSDCDIVIVVLWSRLGSHLKIDGTPYLSGTEYEYEEAINAEHAPKILVYRRTERVQIYADDQKFAEKRKQYQKAQAFFDRFKNPDGSCRGGFTDYATPTDFVSRLEKDLKTILQKRLEATSSAPLTTESLQTQPSWKGSPYPGLRPFYFTEAAIFFGRGHETDALITRLRDPNQRFLAVVGASGSGKSSLVRAGLLPRLLGGAIEGGQHWHAITFTPGATGKDPFLALAFELARVPLLSARKPIEIAEELADEPQRITGYAVTVLAGLAAGAALVLVVDQLEELFTPAAMTHRTAFLDLLAQAAGDPRLRVLATLRADFLSRAVAEPTLRPLLQAPAGTYLLAPPDPLQLAEMIRRPAKRAGLNIEDNMVREVLKDAGRDPGALPLVAFCLEELYRSSAPAHQLTAAAYDDLGRLRGAIGRRTEALLSDLQKTEGVTLDAVLSALFGVLVHIDAAGTVTRRRAIRDDLITELSQQRLVETLIQGRLLQAGDAGGRATITVAHEALLTEWPALHEWVEAHRAQLQRFHRLLLSLASDNLLDRRYAVAALSDMVTVMPKVVSPLIITTLVPALITGLSDDARDVRREVATALGKIGPAAAEAVPALITALGDVDEKVRREVATALRKIGPAAVPALITALGDADENVRGAAISALGKIGPAAAEVVPALITGLSDDARDVRREVATALRKIGMRAHWAVSGSRFVDEGDPARGPRVPTFERAAALQERARKWVPEWVDALLSLGERENGTKRLEEAVEAFRAALQEYTRERLPLDWAMTQNNLGLALAMLGERESGTKRLEEAVEAYRAALQEYTRERVPLQWATAQTGLGLTIAMVGKRTHDRSKLEEARNVINAAFEVVMQAGHEHRRRYFEDRLREIDEQLAAQ